MSCTEDSARGRSPIKRKRNNVSPVWYYIQGHFLIFIHYKCKENFARAAFATFLL